MHCASSAYPDPRPSFVYGRCCYIVTSSAKNSSNKNGFYIVIVSQTVWLLPRTSCMQHVCVYVRPQEPSVLHCVISPCGKLNLTTSESLPVLPLSPPQMQNTRGSCSFPLTTVKPMRVPHRLHCAQCWMLHDANASKPASADNTKSRANVFCRVRARAARKSHCRAQR